MEENFDKIVDRRNTGSIKWDVHHSRDIIPMWIADMDIVCPAAIVNAVKKRADHGIFGYTWTKQSQLQTVINWVQYRHGWAIKPDWIVWMPGLVSALNAMCRGFAAKGEEVRETECRLRMPAVWWN